MTLSKMTKIFKYSEIDANRKISEDKCIYKMRKLMVINIICFYRFLKIL